MRPHFQSKKEFRVGVGRHDRLERLWVQVVREPVVAEPACKAVRVVLLPEPLRGHVFERQVGDAVCAIVHRAVGVTVASEAGFGVEDG